MFFADAFESETEGFIIDERWKFKLNGVHLGF
jgi:hypothetical protein